MKISHDKTAFAGYIKITDQRINSTVQVSPHVMADLDQEGMLCGLEILGITIEKLTTIADSLKHASFSKMAA